MGLWPDLVCISQLQLGDFVLFVSFAFGLDIIVSVECACTKYTLSIAHQFLAEMLVIAFSTAPHVKVEDGPSHALLAAEEAVLMSPLQKLQSIRSQLSLFLRLVRVLDDIHAPVLEIRLNDRLRFNA